MTPDLTSLLTALTHDPDEATCCALHDYLLDFPEQGQTMEARGRLARAYAGAPPQHQDGIGQDWLARILEAMRWDNFALQVRAVGVDAVVFTTELRPYLSAVQQHGTRAIAAHFTAATGGDQLRFAFACGWADRAWRHDWGWMDRPQHQPEADAMQESLAWARRRIKQAVLSLPWAQDVRFGVEKTIDTIIWNDGAIPRAHQLRDFYPNDSNGVGHVISDAGRPVPEPQIVRYPAQILGAFILRQRLTAAQLIWPEVPDPKQTAAPRQVMQ